MAVVLNLTDGTTTIDLMDKAKHCLLEGRLQLPPPPEEIIEAGASSMRDGSDIISRVFRNRTITITLRMAGASQDDMIANWNEIDMMLLTAINAQTEGYGAEVHLEYKWKNATNTVYFDVLAAKPLEPSADFMSAPLNQAHTVSDATVNVMIPEATLELICRPFAHGAFSVTHENYVANPDHERGTTAPGDDWTEYNSDAVGALAWDTVNKYYSSRSCEITHTSGTILWTHGFEAGVDGWADYGAMGAGGGTSQSADWAQTGANSLKVILGAGCGDYAGGAFIPAVAPYQGFQVKFSGWLKRTETTAHICFWIKYQVGGVWTSIFTESAHDVAAQFLSVTQMIPGAATDIAFIVGLNGAEPCTYYIDDVQAEYLGTYYGIQSSNITIPTAASTGYLQVRTRYISGIETFYIGVYDVTHAAWINAALLTATAADGTGWIVKGATFAKPIGCTSLYIRGYFAGDGPSVVEVDGWYLNANQATAPTFWCSCRTLLNHEDGTAGHYNWFDVYDVEGDVPAGIRIAGLVGEIAQRVRQSPYLYIQNYDSSYGALGGGMGTTAHANFQNGSATSTPTAQQLAWTLVEQWQLNVNMLHQYGRVRAWVAYAGNTNIELRVRLRFGSGPTYVDFNGGIGSGTLNTGGATTRAWWDAGVWDLPPAALLPRDGIVDEWWWVVEYKKASGDGQAACLDNIYVTPIKEGYILGNTTTGPNVADSTQEPPYVGRLTTISDDTSTWSMDVTAPKGNPLRAWPTRQNRYHWRGTGVIADTANVRLKVLPLYLMVRGA